MADAAASSDTQTAMPVAQPAAVPPAGGSGLTAAEERQLGELQARKTAAAGEFGTERLRVLPPHVSMTYGGITIGPEFTEVPGNLAGALASAAASAGVEIEQES